MNSCLICACLPLWPGRRGKGKKRGLHLPAPPFATSAAMRGVWYRGWRELGGGLLVMIGLLLSVQGHAVCLDGVRPVEIVTGYHFAGPFVRIATELPLGTVIATAVIPEGSVIARCGGEVQEGIWSAKGLQQRYVMVATNVPGVGVRVVSEKRALMETPAPAPMWRWNPRPTQHSLTQGGLRIELVKTGNISPGVLMTVKEEVQYRMYAGPAVHRRLVMRERLRYQGQLSIEVTGPGAGPGRLSWRRQPRPEAMLWPQAAIEQPQQQTNNVKELA